MLKTFPKGFALNATHHPHLTMLQRYFRTADLPSVYAAAGKVLTADNVANLKLSVAKLDAVPFEKSGLDAMVFLVQRTDALLKLQSDLIAAVSPYTVKNGTAAAYYTTPAAPEISQSTLDYVAAYVPKASGTNFFPHVTVGASTPSGGKSLTASPYPTFGFSAVAATAFQLGNDGTARIRLKTWTFKP